VFDSGRILADGPKDKVLQAVQQQANKQSATQPKQGEG
jgi:hypothetical protein